MSKPIDDQQLPPEQRPSEAPPGMGDNLGALIVSGSQSLQNAGVSTVTVQDTSVIPEGLVSPPPALIFLPSVQFEEGKEAPELPKELAKQRELEATPVWHYTGMLYGNPAPTAYFADAPQSDLTYGQLIYHIPYQADRDTVLKTGLYTVIEGSPKLPEGAKYPHEVAEEEKK